jgi:hypothetical protein
VDPDHAQPSARGAATRTWLAAAVTFVVTFLAVRWLMRQIWPDQNDLSDVGIDLLRVSTSLAVATAAAIGVGLLSHGRSR